MAIHCPLSNTEKTFLLQSLMESQRLDGRSFSEYRQIKLEFPPIEKYSCGNFGLGIGGSCLCRFGNTTVIAEVWCEIGEPSPRKPSEGQLNVNLDLGALNAAGAPKSDSEEGSRVQPMLKQCLRDCIDLEALCIVAGERVFLLRVEARVMCHDGNLLDCAALASVAALSVFRRPDVSVNEKGEIIIHTDCLSRDPVPLTFRHLPIIMTFGLVSSGNLIVLDPLLKEELILDGFLRVSMNRYRQISFLHTSGGLPIEEQQIKQCLKLAEEKVHGLHCLLKRSIASVEQNRLSKNLTEINQPVFITSTSLLTNKETRWLKDARLSEGELSEEEHHDLPDPDSDMDVIDDEEEHPSQIPPPGQGPMNPYSIQEVWGDIEQPDTEPINKLIKRSKKTRRVYADDEEEQESVTVVL